MSISANCNICFGVYPIDKFRILTCGHGHCGTCTDRIETFESGRGTSRKVCIKCPLCREVVRKEDVSKGIYLELVDAKTATVANVVDGMGKMHQDAPLASVTKAGEKLDRGAKASKGNVDLTSQLLQAIEDFKARIVPLFEKVRRQEEDLNTARREAHRQLAERQALEKRLARADTIRAENAQLRDQLATSTRIAEETTIAGTEMRDQMVALQSELASYKKIAADLDADKRRMADQLERNANAARTAKEKYKRAKQENEEWRKKLSTATEHRQQEIPSSPITPQHPLYQNYEDSLEAPMPSQMAAPVRPPPMEEEFSWEGIPRPGFGSGWHSNNSKENQNVLKKNRPAGVPVNQNRRVTNPILPLKLNRKGQPTAAVQIGPKRGLRAFAS